MDPVALAAGELADLLLLVGALEVEAGDIGAARHLALAELDDIESVGDFFPDGLVRPKRVARLVDIAELDRIADAQGAAIDLLLAHDHAEEGRLAGTVGADDADDAAGRQAEIEIVDQEPFAEGLAQMLGGDHEVAQPRARGNADLAGLGLLLAALREELLIGG